MMALSPLDLEFPAIWHQEQLMREAESERLARALPRSPRPSLKVRPRLAALLHALANRLEPACSAPEPAPARG
jgi:hypothetical protein